MIILNNTAVCVLLMFVLSEFVHSFLSCQLRAVPFVCGDSEIGSFFCSLIVFAY